MAARGGGTRAGAHLRPEGAASSVHWGAEARRRLRVRCCLHGLAFAIIAVAVIGFRVPEWTPAGMACAARDTWLPVVVLGGLLASLAVDIAFRVRHGLGHAAMPLDLRIGAGIEGGGPPAFYSRRAKWLVLYPVAIVMTVLFLYFAPASTCP